MASVASVESSELKCLICLELPESEVYQCKEGHPLCSKCFFKNQLCPQCRIPLGKKKIPDIVVESILDKRDFPCQNKEVGCDEMLKRHEKLEHHRSCLYKWRLPYICDALGFKCEFKTNLLKPSEALAHFQEEHELPVESKPYASISLQKFDQIDGSKNMTWTPFILNLGETSDSPKFLIQMLVQKRDKMFRMGCVVLEDPLKDITTNYTVRFSIKSNSSKVVHIDWSLYPRVFSANVARTSTLFKLPINLLQLHYISEGNLNLAVNVTTGSDLLERRDSQCVGVSPLCLFPTENFKEYSRTLPCICDECKSKTNEHRWYCCLQCKRFILCQDCLELKKHSHHVFAMLTGIHYYVYLIMLVFNNRQEWMVILPTASNTEIEDSDDDGNESFPIECSFCRCFPIIGILYRCLLCPINLNVCQGCVEKGEHRCHILGAMVNRKQEEFWNSQKKPGSPLMPLLASNVNLS